MTNPYIQLYKKQFPISLKEKLLHRTHLYFHEDDKVTEKSFYPSNEERLVKIDFGICKPCFQVTLKTNDSYLLGKSLIRRKHIYFNENSSITDRNPTPATALKLFIQDLGCSTPNYKQYAHEKENEKDQLREYLSCDEDMQPSRENASQSSNINMSWTDSEISLPSRDLQLIEKHLLCSFGMNCIQRKHLYFNEDGDATDKSPNISTALELFEDDIKWSNIKLNLSMQPYENTQGRQPRFYEDGKIIGKGRHYWFDDDGKLIDKSSYATTTTGPETVIQDDFTCLCQNFDNVSPECTSLNFHIDFDENRGDILDESASLYSTNGEITNSKNDLQSDFSDLSRDDDNEESDQFTSLKIKEKDSESIISEKSLPILESETDLHFPNEDNLQFSNEPTLLKDHFDNSQKSFEEDDFWSFVKESNITNLPNNSEPLAAKDLQYILPKDQLSPQNDLQQTKDFITEHSPDFLQLPFGRDSNRHFLIEDEVAVVKRCPMVSCRMCVKTPRKHFKHHHPELPKWKKKTCLALLDLYSVQDTFQIKRCLFCNSLEVNIKDHLCRFHRLPPKTKLYEEIKSRCPIVPMNNTGLLIQTVSNAFKSYQRSKGLKRKDVDKQLLFIRELLPKLSDDLIPESMFVQRLLTSNMCSLINVLLMQKQPFNKLLHKQLMTLGNFLEFLHVNSDIFSPPNEDWWEQVLPSWNVLELNENQLILVSCKI